MVNISFDEATHIYKVDNKVTPSVTQILNDMGLTDFSRVSPDIMQRKQKFGTAVHKATEFFDMNILDFDTLDPALVPYIEAWQKFKDENDVKIVAIEKKVYHPVFKYVGTLDRLLEIRGKLTVGDIKTSTSMIPATKLQLAGYAAAEKHEQKTLSIDRLGIQLKGDGTYNLEPYTGFQDESLFLSAASLWWWRKNNNLLKESA